MDADAESLLGQSTAAPGINAAMMELSQARALPRCDAATGAEEVEDVPFKPGFLDELLTDRQSYLGSA